MTIVKLFLVAVISYLLGSLNFGVILSRKLKKEDVRDRGSGPSGLSCAEYLNRAGINVTVYESAEHVGGFMRYGIPDFRLPKSVIERRVSLMTL